MTTSASNATYDYKGISNVYSSGSASTSNIVHKTFDLSNTAIGSSKLRQFHQTRIYVEDFNGMVSKGQNVSASNATYLFSANLPESIGYALGSRWEQPIPGMTSALANALIQFGSTAAGKLGQSLSESNNSFISKAGSVISDVSGQLPSGINRAATMLVWGGSDPLQLSLKIPVIDDRNLNSNSTIALNFTEALEFLSCLVLPKKESALGFYTPPPSPLRLSLKYGTGDSDVFSTNSTYARIMVQLGGMLLVDKCLIKGIRVNYPDTKSMIKHYTSIGKAYLSPLLAEITIDITTIEALTTTAFSQMLWLSSQNQEAEGTADVSKLFG